MNYPDNLPIFTVIILPIAIPTILLIAMLIVLLIIRHRWSENQPYSELAFSS